MSAVHDSNLGPTHPAGGTLAILPSVPRPALCPPGARRATQSSCYAKFIPPEATPWPFHAQATRLHHRGSVLGLICPRASSEITVEVILCKYSRHCAIASAGDKRLQQFLASVCAAGRCWAEAPVKIARMTLTIKLDGNWSSFQLANNTPPLSVTGSVIAPSARMCLKVALGLAPGPCVFDAMFRRPPSRGDRRAQTLLRTPSRTRAAPALEAGASQRSLHNAPIFRLLLKVAVKGTHQCDCLNF